LDLLESLEPTDLMVLKETWEIWVSKELMEIWDLLEKWDLREILDQWDQLDLKGKQELKVNKAKLDLLALLELLDLKDHRESKVILVMLDLLALLDLKVKKDLKEPKDQLELPDLEDLAANEVSELLIGQWNGSSVGPGVDFWAGVLGSSAVATPVFRIIGFGTFYLTFENIAHLNILCSLGIIQTRITCNTSSHFAQIE